MAGAVGDALGAPVKFDPVAEIRVRCGEDGVAGYLPVYGRRGAITDDTQMTLFGSEGLLRAEQRYRDRGLDDVDATVLRSYQRWAAEAARREPGRLALGCVLAVVASSGPCQVAGGPRHLPGRPLHALLRAARPAGGLVHPDRLHLRVPWEDPEMGKGSTSAAGSPPAAGSAKGVRRQGWVSVVPGGVRARRSPCRHVPVDPGGDGGELGPDVEQFVG
jgi:hypothetical protein